MTDNFVVFNTTAEQAVSATRQALFDPFEIQYIQKLPVTVVNTTAETPLIDTTMARGLPVIPQDSIPELGRIRLVFGGSIADTGNPTMKYRVYMGSVLVAETIFFRPAITLVEEHWCASLLLTADWDGGSTATFRTCGFLEHARDADDNIAGVSFTATGNSVFRGMDQTISVTVEWSVANPSNNVTLDTMEIQGMK